MSKDKTEDSNHKPVDREKLLIQQLVDNIDLGSYIANDHIDLEVDLIPGLLKAVYRSPYGSEVLETEKEIKELNLESESEEYHYRIFRSLATSIQSINDESFMPGAGIPVRIEALKRKPKHIIDRLLWGHVLFNEAIRKVVEEPEVLEEKLKKHSGTPSTSSD